MSERTCAICGRELGDEYTYDRKRGLGPAAHYECVGLKPVIREPWEDTAYDPLYDHPYYQEE